MQDLTATYEGGPKYSNKEILRDPSSFVIKCGEDVQSLGIDGKTICAVPISLYGFNVRDFNHIPVNEYGLKTVAKYWVSELMVTALGLFVIYSHEIPSLRGLPSKVIPISGPTVTITGNLLLPKFSLFTQQEYNSYALVALQNSFNCSDTESYTEATYLSPEVFSQEPSFRGVGYCNHFNPLYNSSAYTYLYPMVTLEDLTRYVKLVLDGEPQTIEVGNNF